MGGYLVVIGLALVAAIGVIVLANAAGDGGTDLRTFWADLRSGLRRRGRDDDEQSPVVDEAEPVDVPFDQLFAEASQPDDGYLQLDELAEMLERTGERAARLREHLPSGRAAAGEPVDRVVVQDRVPAPGTPAPAVSEHAPAPAAHPGRQPRRSGHLPVRTVTASPARPAATATAATVAGPVALPPTVPPQRGDA